MQNMSDSSPATIPPDKEEISKVVYHREQHVRIAPVSSARELAEYEEVLPGLAERIVHMSEKEQAHAIKTYPYFLVRCVWERSFPSSYRS